MHDSTARILVLGIGNILMGDEGIGVHVVRYLQEQDLPESVACLDGGTGSFQLLEPLQLADRIIMIDATIDGGPPGRVRRLTPRFSKDYPPSLTAHDIGLKDLLDAYYLLGEPQDVILFAVSISPLSELSIELSSHLAGCVPEIAKSIRREIDALFQARDPG